MLKVKEMYLTKQGEGFHTGRRAIFCRFVGCNLWSGLEKDRATAACRFCDTNFRGMDGENGGRYTPQQLVQRLTEIWDGAPEPFVVFTGGEPLLQLSDLVIELCKEAGFYVSVETNGTRPLPKGLDWVCVSPKPRSTIVVESASEIKLVFPQVESEMHPTNFVDFVADHHFLQPLDNADRAHNTSLVEAYCSTSSVWKISCQMHKVWGIQ